MQVSVEAPSKLERRMTIIISVEKLEEAYDKRLAKLAKTVKVNGFRAGKMPLNIIKQRYGDTARNEALSELIQSSLYAAINQEKLNPVGTPMVQPKVIQPGQPLEFIATFEVLPEVENVTWDLTTIEKQVATLAEEDIEKVLSHLKQQHTIWTVVNRPAAEKNQVVIDFRGSMEGKVFEGGEAHDYPIVLGSNTMIPGFEEGIIGMSAGEEKTIAVTFPETYFAKEFAGKPAEFHVKVLRISEANVPEMTEEFVKKLGVKNGKIEELRAEIRKNLDRELTRVVKAKLKNKVFDYLLEKNSLEIPKALIEREAKRIHDELHPNHVGKDHSHSEAENASFDAAAKRNVALGLLVAAIIKQFKIDLDKTRLDAYIASLSAAYENPAEVVTWYTNNKRAYSEIEMQVLEEQVVEKLLENVTVNEKMISYSELIAK